MLVHLVALLAAQLASGGIKADVNGDGVADLITAAGPGGAPHVKVFDGKTGQQLHSFLAYDAGFRGGVTVAAGDVNGDGRADIVTGAGAGGGPHVKVFNGATGQLIRSFMAFEANFKGGVRVATGDVNGDGKSDITVTANGTNAAGQAHVKVFNGASGAELSSSFVRPARARP